MIVCTIKFPPLVQLLIAYMQRWADTHVTLAFDDAKVIRPFYREETYLGHIWDISVTYLGCIWDIYGT